VVSSFRKPDVIRFGISPVAISHEDVRVAVPARMFRAAVWREPRFKKVSV
jgi:kynureninase